LTGVCSDPDAPFGQVLNFTWTSSIVGLLGHGASLTLSLREVGLHTITLTVTDGEYQVTDTVTVEVIPRNDGDPGTDPGTDPGDETAGQGTSGFGTGLILAVLVLAFIYGYCAYADFLGREETHIVFILVYFFFGLLRIATSAATSITSEKEAQTWPILLITSLTERQIVFGKIIGSCLGGWAFWLLLIGHVLVFSLAGFIPLSAILPLTLLIVSSMLLVSAVGVFFSSCFKRSSISATINLILFFSFTAPVCCPSPLPTYLVSPLFAAVMILGVTGGWSGIDKSFQRTGGVWEWFGAFLFSGLALLVLVAIYLSLALGAFAIAVTNIRRGSLQPATK